MEKVSIAGFGAGVTRLGLGGCPFGRHGWGPVDDRESIKAVQRACDLGVNFFDTADVYGFGHSESIFRKALGARRHDVHVATKFGVRWDKHGRIWKDASPAYLHHALDASLERLGLEAIDLYYLHWPDPMTPIEKTLEGMERLRCQGKIRAIGLSNITANQLRTAVQIAPIATVQLQFSLIDREKFELFAPVAEPLGIQLVTWGSLGQGLLSGKYGQRATFCEGDRRLRYDNFQGEKFQRNLRLVQEVQNIAAQIGRTPAQIALRWLLDTTSVGCALFGAKTSAQVEDNLGALGWQLPSDGYDRLEQLSGRLVPWHNLATTRKKAA